jgi:hypothetical protein
VTIQKSKQNVLFIFPDGKPTNVLPSLPPSFPSCQQSILPPPLTPLPVPILTMGNTCSCLNSGWQVEGNQMKLPILVSKVDLNPSQVPAEIESLSRPLCRSQALINNNHGLPVTPRYCLLQAC